VRGDLRDGVAVGTPVTRRPPQGSGRALASASGSYRRVLTSKRRYGCTASRTRRSPADAYSQRCIWDAAVGPMFSLVGRLPSMPSASEKRPPLFRHFAGTTQPSDSLPAFMPRFWLITFLGRPAHHFVSGTARASRFSRVEVPCISGVLDLAGPVGARDIVPTRVAFPMNKQGRHPDSPSFRGSIPRLHVPLSTLRAQPYD
jgi:hypothetical protein